MRHTAQVRHLLGLYESIASGAGADKVASFFHPDAEQIEYPSALRPQGHRRGLAEMRAGAALGATMIADQHYDLHHVVEEGDHIAVQFTWTARVVVDLGAIPAGTSLVSHVAAFYVFRDGLVLRQSSYDCYEPLAARTRPDRPSDSMAQPQLAARVRQNG